MSALYSNIKRLANAHKISLAELERNLKFSNGIISTWKKGNPSIDKVEKVANYFDVSTDYLLGRTSNPTDNDSGISWLDLDMPYGGKIPDDLKGMYRALAEQYVKYHPESLKKD